MSFSELVNLRDSEDSIDEIPATEISELEKLPAEPETTETTTDKQEEPIKNSEDKKRVAQIIDITKDIILIELEATLKWSKTYGNGYVSKNYLIYNTLKPKRYDYKKGLTLLDELIEEGKVVTEFVNIEGHRFESLRLKKENNDEATVVVQ